MFKDQNLYFNDMIEKINKAKEDLEKNNETLEEAKDKIRAFINDNTFRGLAAETTKTQMETYIIVANAMIQANDCDIDDYQALLNELNSVQDSVGGDDLIGEVIQEQMINAKRMEKEDRNKAAEYKRKQKESYFPHSDYWYAFKAYQYTSSAEDNEKLYDKWKEKSEKYDEVQRNTSNLFENSRQLRQKAENALRELGQNFNGTSFDVADDDKEWKDALIKFMTENGYYIGFEDWFLDIGGKFGGNQGWFDETHKWEYALDEILKEEDLTDEQIEMLKDKKLNKAIAKGCGIIALVNWFYYLKGEKPTKKEFILKVYEFIDDHFLYGQFSKRIKPGMYNDMPGLSTDFQGYMQEYLDKNKNLGVKKAKCEYVDDGSLDKIKDSMREKRPVALYLHDAPEGKQFKFYKEKSSGNVEGTGELELDQEVAEHFVTITGVKKFVNSKTHKMEDYVQVSSWGKK